MKKIDKTIAHINKAGVLLVFPIKNKKDPFSLWSSLYPRSEMRWDWDETGDDRVVNLWHTMKELSHSRKVVYSKWIQNRATFFSLDCFTALVAYLSQKYDLQQGLLPEAKEILFQLKEESPLSTKEIKKLTGLQGRLYEGLYNKAMRQLFERALIVGFGEKDDGAFPSALMGSTELLFEGLCTEAKSLNLEIASKKLTEYFDDSPALTKQLNKIEKSLQ